MPRALVVATVSTSLLAIAAAGIAEARSVQKQVKIKEPLPQQAMHDHFIMEEFGRQGRFTEPFAMQGIPLGESSAPAATPAQAAQQGSTIAAYRGGAIVIDSDSGELVRTDGDGVPLAKLMVGPGAGQLVVDAKRARAYVADRSGDRVLVIDLADNRLRKADSFSTAAEPHGLAMTPDGRTLLVTTVADHSLTAFDLATGDTRWELELGPEPRGVAVSPQGHEALITFLTTGAVARVDLSNDAPRMSFVSLDPGIRASTGNDVAVDPLSDEGKSFARSAFAVGYVGHDMAVVPHQLSTPHLASGDFETESSGYGGGNGFTPPITHRLAFLAMPDAGEKGSVRTVMAGTNVHQPRALAYDGRSDTLYVAGYGSDDVQAIADVSQASVHLGWQFTVPKADDGGACGPTGLSVDPDDGHVLVFCSLTRRTVRLAKEATVAAGPTVVAHSQPLAKSRLSAEAQRGQELFRRGNAAEISSFGAMACASCHPEVRADGLSWRLQGKNLQTPFLAGRIEGAHPFKWDGKDPNIQASLINTVQRLGGMGISITQAEDMAAFLESVDKPRAPSVSDHSAVARGKALFESETTGCITCHNGPLLTDQNQYDLDTDLEEADTPSLIGLASSAPYYHDGSARTLEALLRGNASIHGMGDISPLSDGQIGDLVQYLKTL